MTDFTDLIARLAAASEGSRELDAEIGACLKIVRDFDREKYLPSVEFKFVPESDGVVHVLRKLPSGKWHPEHGRHAPAYSTSLDAALQLVPEGAIPTCQ